MLPRIESFIEENIGINSDTLGSDIIPKAVRFRMHNCGIDEVDEYFMFLKDSPQEWQSLIEKVVIPETWFFRNNPSFSFLNRYTQEKLNILKCPGKIKILCIPCSTGEEAYSIAFTLMEAGCDENRVAIDAIDVSEQVLKKARQGIYSMDAFRDKDRTFDSCKHYFEPVERGDKSNYRSLSQNVKVLNSVKKLINFKQGNIFDENSLSKKQDYDIIFCRNLLIYMNARMKKRAIKNLNRWAKKNALMFMGHAEQNFFIDKGFIPVREPKVFACKKITEKITEKPQKITPLYFQNHPTKKTYLSPLKKIKKRKISQDVNTVTKQDKINTLHSTFHNVRALIDSGSYLKAKGICDGIIDENSFSTEAYLLKGIICQNQKNFLNAVDAYKRVLYLDPEHIEALSRLEEIFLQCDIEKAVFYKQRIMRIKKRRNKS